MEFTSFSQTHVLFKKPTFTKVPELSSTSQICPWFTKITLERSGSPQLGPWGQPRRSSPESGEAGGAPGRKGGGEGSRAHPSSILLVGREVWWSGGGAWRHPASVAAAVGNSGEARAELGNTWRGKLLCGLGMVQGGWPVTKRSARWSSVRSCQWRQAEWLGVGSMREETWPLFYRRRARTRAANGAVVRWGGRSTRGARRVAGVTLRRLSARTAWGNGEPR
jgi:hypothetical protein